VDKFINNKNIFKFAENYLKLEEINALILDGPFIRTSQILLNLQNLKKILIIEGNKDHLIDQNILIKKLISSKFYEYEKIILVNDNIFNYYNTDYYAVTNLIYLDINTNFISIGQGKNKTKGAKFVVKKILKSIQKNKIVFAMTFSLRTGIKNLTHYQHSKYINSKLKKYFKLFGFKLCHQLKKGKEVIYRSNSGNGSLYFNIFYLKKVNLN